MVCTTFGRGGRCLVHKVEFLVGRRLAQVRAAQHDEGTHLPNGPVRRAGPSERVRRRKRRRDLGRVRRRMPAVDELPAVGAQSPNVRERHLPVVFAQAEAQVKGRR